MVFPGVLCGEAHPEFFLVSFPTPCEPLMNVSRNPFGKKVDKSCRRKMKKPRRPNVPFPSQGEEFILHVLLGERGPWGKGGCCVLSNVRSSSQSVQNSTSG